MGCILKSLRQYIDSDRSVGISTMISRIQRRRSNNDREMEELGPNLQPLLIVKDLKETETTEVGWRDGKQPDMSKLQWQGGRDGMNLNPPEMTN